MFVDQIYLICEHLECPIDEILPPVHAVLSPVELHTTADLSTESRMELAEKAVELLRRRRPSSDVPGTL